MSSHKRFAVNLFYLSKLCLGTSFMNYLQEKCSYLQLFSLQFSGECYIFKCVKINLFLRTKLGTFLVK